MKILILIVLAMCSGLAQARFVTVCSESGRCETVWIQDEYKPIPTNVYRPLTR